MRVQATLESLREILCTLVVMEHEDLFARRWIAAYGLLDCVDRELLRDVVWQRPANHLARDGVYYANKIRPPRLAGLR